MGSCMFGKWNGPETEGPESEEDGSLGSRSRWRFRMSRTPRTTKHIRAAPPIAPPTMAPTLLGEDWDLAPEDESVDDDLSDAGFVGFDVPVLVGGGDGVLWSEDGDEDGPEDEEVGEVVEGMVV